ncbi:MAG TPA: DNA polymerase III subunit [Gemmatimonadales bacterium]|nr:DNA polymerase III subunit [Gemmatimonadales bacterium]
MPLPPLDGHEGTRNRLAGAIASGRLPQALLFEGPSGVGKQRLALWLAQLLMCENGSGGEPCGTCQACRLVMGLSHPDVHWFVPLEPSRQAADADKQVDLVRDALAEEMAERREHPLWAPPSGLAIHGIAAVRLLLRELALKPALGRRKVFIIGDAERLVPQTGTEAAANALLKALEEPPADTTIVLTTALPAALLPTIVSRVVHVRVARLADSVVAAFVQRELGVTAQHEVAQRVAIADGCPGRLLANGEQTGESGAAERFLAAIEQGPVDRYAFALSQQPFQARGGFTAMLDELLQRLREKARAGGETRTVVAAISHVLEARSLAQGNLNPQLVAAVLADDLG